MGYVHSLADVATRRNDREKRWLGMVERVGRVGGWGQVSNMGLRHGGGGGKRCFVTLPAAEWMVYKDTRDVVEDDVEGDEGGGDVEGDGAGHGGGGSSLAVIEVKGPNGLEVTHTPIHKQTLTHTHTHLLINHYH